MSWCVAYRGPLCITREAVANRGDAVDRVHEIMQREPPKDGGYWAEVFVNTWEKINSKEEGSIYIFEEKQ